jgi:hypothetical protein
MVPVLGSARRRVVVGLLLFAFAAIVVGTGWSSASATAQSSSSDPRARFVPGNVTTCSGVGFSSDVQVGSSSDGNAADADVQGIVKSNSGSTRDGQGEELDVAIAGGGIVIDAVVVKGGPAYNLYTNPTVLPPARLPDEHYISPFNGGGNVPSISHWFVCYRGAPSPTTTSTTTTTGATTTTTPPSPPDTRSRSRTTISSTPTTPAAQAVSSPGSTVPPGPKASTTRPTATTTSSTAPRPLEETIPAEAVNAPVSLPETGASTASFVVGCATAILGLVVLALRPRA